MALFSRKNSDNKSKSGKTVSPKGTVSAERSSYLSEILRRPRITEKATNSAENKVYVFDVSPRANKLLISEAVRHFFNVSPRKIRIAPIPKKPKVRRGIKGVSGGGKKAYVYLNKEDKIELM